MVWQRAGTVAVQTGSTTVVGTNVDFAASSRNGDSFVGPDGATYEVANVASSTVISILPAYKGSTVSGAAYAIMPVQGYDKMLSDAFNNLNNQFGPKLAALGTTGNYDILPVAKGGTGAQTPAGARAGLELTPTAVANMTTSTVSTTTGQVTKVGDYGLGLPLINMPIHADGAVDANCGAHFNYLPASQGSPSGTFDCAMLTMGINQNYAIQLVGDVATGNLYTRYRNAGTQSQGFIKFYSTANTTRAADGTLKAI